MPMPLRKPLEKTCVACGSPFLCGGRGRPRVTQRMCSMACQQASRFRRGTTAKDVPDTTAAYLAGLIDGEGSIMLTGRPTGSVHLRLTISNTDRPILEWTLDRLGIGAIYRHRDATARHKAGYSWRCHGDGAESVLLQIRPFLRIKAAQADLALAHHAGLRDPARKADRSWQAENRAAMKLMNKRGGITGC